MAAAQMYPSSSPLPDPRTQPGFYTSIPMKRLLAFVFDVLFIFALTFLVSVLTFGLGFLVFAGIYAIISLIYRIATLSNRSATWGMRLMAMEMRTAQGARFDLGTAALHTLGTAASFAVAPLQLISVILMLTTARAQGLTDHVLGTVALNRAAQR